VCAYFHGNWSDFASPKLATGERSSGAATPLGILLVEQHIHYAATVVDRALVMNEGAIRAEVPGSDLTAREAEIERIYLGGIDESRQEQAPSGGELRCGWAGNLPRRNGKAVLSNSEEMFQYR
jgi:hypothetical protein